MISVKLKKQDFQEVKIEVVRICDDIICTSTSIQKEDQLNWGEGNDEKI